MRDHMIPHRRKGEMNLKNQDIYNAALKILAQRDEEGANEDYEERAPYLIAAFCCESARADEAYRKANGLPKPTAQSAVYLELGADFPCCSRFAATASVYLASMLVIDEAPELSDKLFDKYSDMMSAICMEIPAEVERISDRYGY